MSDPSLGLRCGAHRDRDHDGFPTAFTLMCLGMAFGYIAFWGPGQHWYDNRIFDLIAAADLRRDDQRHPALDPAVRLHGLCMSGGAGRPSVPRRAARLPRVPASLAVTTLLVAPSGASPRASSAPWSSSMGVIAMRPMLKAATTEAASGAITARGTLGILIPAVGLLIVYAAVAGQSIVKLSAAAMLPGVLPTFLSSSRSSAGRSSTPRSLRSCGPTIPRGGAGLASRTRARSLAERRPGLVASVFVRPC